MPALEAKEQRLRRVMEARLWVDVLESSRSRGPMPVIACIEEQHAGQTIPGRSCADHDWVLVEAGRRQHRCFVDPSLYDLGLGWDIEGMVRGSVATP